MKKWKKYVFLTHRYLGLFLAPLILLWSISGIVMMYVAYPKLTDTERLQLLPWLGNIYCCDQRFLEKINHLDLAELSLERLEGSIIAKIKTTANERATYQFSKNRWLTSINEESAIQVFKENFNKEILSVEKIERDQWTVYSKYNVHRPLFKIILDDDQGKEVYISSKNGEVVQITTSFQRNWSWIGAVTHWLYPTVLRKHTKLWYWLVIGLSILSLLAVISGTWIGIKQLKKRKNKPLSPYKGMRLLHHWGGVFIALLLFLFLLSGLLSMNPWGLLERKSYPVDTALGTKVKSSDVLDSLEKFYIKKQNSDLVQLKLASWNNKVYWLGSFRDGQVIRYDKNFKEALIPNSELKNVGKVLGGESVSQYLLTEEDRYYFSHKRAIELPVWKIIADNEMTGEVLFYLSPTTGEMIKTVGENGRLYRWLFNALHRWDFSSLVRQRPIWDFLLVPFMVLLALFGFTGCYLAWKRLRR